MDDEKTKHFLQLISIFYKYTDTYALTCKCNIFKYIFMTYSRNKKEL